MSFLKPKPLKYLFISLLGAGHLSAAVENEPEHQVRLVLQITVDGLRADLLTRYQHHFVEGGFNRFLNEGARYVNAHYQHANTETIVGHTTLATGASPAQHGMTGNVWYDRETGELAYNIEDPAHPILATRENPTKGAQVDPAQKMARTQGRSPNTILIPTLGDTLKIFTGGNAKVFGVSGKDRSAVAMAGKTGKAYWSSTDTGDFVTSTYYEDAYPDWVKAWNSKNDSAQYSGKHWKLRHQDKSKYIFGDRDDRPYETDLKGYGITFPHAFGEPNHPLFNTRLLVSPIGDRRLSNFAKTLILREGIGLDDIPDYLSISFSGVDAVNHFFGPSSLENEDIVVQLDRTLADFMDFIDSAVGLERTITVLSADHGMADTPEYATELGYDAGRLQPSDILDVANRVGQEELGIEGISLFFFRPYLYLNQHKVEEAGVSWDVAKLVVAQALGKSEGISTTFAHVNESPSSTTKIENKILRNFHPERSGDVYVAQSPYWFLHEKGAVSVMHGSPWAYDTHVPIIFLGRGIRSQRISREVQPADVTPTIAALLGMTPPAGATGAVLTEVFARDDQNK